MYQIALCDDEPSDLEKMKRILETYQELHSDCNLSIRCFTSAEELLRPIRGNEYLPDLIFMDIYMPEKPGIDAAKELRDMGADCRIIFSTTSKEHALDAFRIDAAQYLVKPVAEQMVIPVLDKLLVEMKEDRLKYLLLRIEGRICRIALHDIVYCEAQRKCQCLFFADGTQALLRMTMTEIFTMLSGYREFVKAGISYIINLEHIESLNARELKMDTGAMIYLPRGSYQTIKEQYFQYYCGT